LPKLYSPCQCQRKVLSAKQEKAYDGVSKKKKKNQMEFQEVIINQEEMGNF
jgi:hypothetical protein